MAFEYVYRGTLKNGDHIIVDPAGNTIDFNGAKKIMVADKRKTTGFVSGVFRNGRLEVGGRNVQDGTDIEIYKDVHGWSPS